MERLHVGHAGLAPPRRWRKDLWFEWHFQGLKQAEILHRGPKGAAMVGYHKVDKRCPFISRAVEAKLMPDEHNGIHTQIEPEDRRDGRQNFHRPC